MQKRKATTELTRDGEAIPRYEEAPAGEDSTPQEISQRRIFRARRPQKSATTDEPTSFKLKTQLVSEDLESKLLAAKPASFNFMDIPDVEVREVSPIKSTQPSKPAEPAKVESPSFTAFAGILSDMKTKKEEDIVSSFIQSAANKEKSEELVSPKFQDNVHKSETNHYVSIEGRFSLNGVSRGEGYVEISKGNIGDNKMNLLVFRNSFKSIIYQGVLADSAKWKDSEKQAESDEEEEEKEDKISLEIVAYRKTDKLRAETCKIRTRRINKSKLLEGLEKAKKDSQLKEKEDGNISK